jgi:hypothetical protein
MPTIFSSSYPNDLLTSQPDLSPSKWDPSNPPVLLHEQYPSDIHLQNDWNLSDCCFPNHLLLGTIPQTCVISCSCVPSLLVVTYANWELPCNEITIPGIAVYLYPWRVQLCDFTLNHHTIATVTTLKGRC